MPPPGFTMAVMHFRGVRVPILTGALCSGEHEGTRAECLLRIY